MIILTVAMGAVLFEMRTSALAAAQSALAASEKALAAARSGTSVGRESTPKPEAAANLSAIDFGCSPPKHMRLSANSWHSASSPARPLRPVGNERSPAPGWTAPRLGAAPSPPARRPASASRRQPGSRSSSAARPCRAAALGSVPPARLERGRSGSRSGFQSSCDGSESLGPGCPGAW